VGVIGDEVGTIVDIVGPGVKAGKGVRLGLGNVFWSEFLIR
jgi:hypothetical protein